MPTIKALYLEFIDTIKNISDIIKAWAFYIKTLPKIKWDYFQYDDCEDFLLNKEFTCWNYCRAGGKTEKASLLAVFLMIRGEQCHWYASTTKQLEQAQEYWNNNPYVKPFIISRARPDIMLINGTRMGIACLSIGNASGPRAANIFYDEVALMKKEVIVKSWGLANHIKDPRVLMFSTPILGSSFHEMVRKFGQHKRIYTDCSWFNHKGIEAQKLKGLEWLWEQENLCKFTSPTGRVFPESHLIFEDSKDWNKLNLINVRQGVDFGGTKGHNLHRIAQDDSFFYLLKEEKFQYKLDDKLLQKRCDEYPTEIEEGGWNDIFAPNITGVMKKDFSMETKVSKIRILLGKPIKIDETLTPKTLEEIRKLVWDEKGKIETNELDYVSAFLHSADEIIEEEVDSEDGYDEEYDGDNPYTQYSDMISMMRDIH